LIHNGSSANLFNSTDIVDAHNYTLYTRDANTSGNIFLKNRISAAPIIRMLLINNTSTLINNTIGTIDTKFEFTLLSDSTLVLQNNIMLAAEGIIKSDSGYEPLPLSARQQSKKSALDIYLNNQNHTK
jgi:hypothetical protein